MKNPVFKPKLSLFFGMLLETLSLVLFVMIFQDISPDFIELSAYPKPLLYFLCAIGFGIGFGLVMRNILEHRNNDET